MNKIQARKRKIRVRKRKVFLREYVYPYWGYYLLALVLGYLIGYLISTNYSWLSEIIVTKLGVFGSN